MFPHFEMDHELLKPDLETVIKVKFRKNNMY